MGGYLESPFQLLCGRRVEEEAGEEDRGERARDIGENGAEWVMGLRKPKVCGQMVAPGYYLAPG